MNKKLNHWLWVVLLLVFCTSCEYELEETNFVEIKKPQDVNYKIQIKAPTNGNGEYVVKYSFIKFDFELPNDVNDIIFRLYRENEDYNFNTFYASKTSPYLSFSWWVDPGKYILKCEIPPSRTNTGSLADIAGYEYYGKTFEWKIVIQQNPIPSLNLRYERLSDTTFKLYWNKPDADYGQIDYYEIYDYWSGRLGTTQETSYVVTLYQWDSRHFYVRAYFKENFLSPLESSVYISNY